MFNAGNWCSMVAIVWSFGIAKCESQAIGHVLRYLKTYFTNQDLMPKSPTDERRQINIAELFSIESSHLFAIDPLLCLSDSRATEDVWALGCRRRSWSWLSPVQSLASLREFKPTERVWSPPNGLSLFQRLSSWRPFSLAELKCWRQSRNPKTETGVSGLTWVSEHLCGIWQGIQHHLFSQFDCGFNLGNWNCISPSCLIASSSTTEVRKIP